VRFDRCSLDEPFEAFSFSPNQRLLERTNWCGSSILIESLYPKQAPGKSRPFCKPRDLKHEGHSGATRRG
jgi:hypothetical protein